MASGRAKISLKISLRVRMGGLQCSATAKMKANTSASGDNSAGDDGNPAGTEGRGMRRVDVSCWIGFGVAASTVGAVDISGAGTSGAANAASSDECMARRRVSSVMASASERRFDTSFWRHA